MPHFPGDSDISGTEYDVAHVKWGGSWVMPSETQCIELSENCTSIWTTKNGVDGKLLTGPSGSVIFLPAAGYRDGTTLNNAGRNGYMWVSDLDWLGITTNLGVSYSYIGVQYEEYSYTGRSVRAIVGQ